MQCMGIIMPEQYNNQVFYYLYWLIVSMASAGGVVFFLYQYLKPRFSVFTCLIPFTSYIFVLAIFRDNMSSLLRAAVLTPLLFILCTSLVFYGTLKRKLIIVGACYLCILIVESMMGIILLLLRIDYSQYNSNPFFITLYSGIIVNIFLILFSIILRPILKSNYTFGQKADKAISVMVASAAVTVALLLCYIIKLPQQNVTALIAASLNICMTVGCLLLICYLLTRMEIAMEHEKEQELLRQRYELSLLRAEQVTCYKREIYDLYSGMKRELDDICSCIKNRNISAASEITSKNISAIGRIKPTKSYGNNVLDYLIPKAEKQCKTSRIIFQVECSLAGDTSIDDMDFCVVLSNILDNAVNACNQLTGKRYIHLSIHKNHNILFIGCVNSRTKGESVKKPKRRLGNFGLRNIRSTADKYNGDVQINQDNEQFTIEVLLYCSE